MCEGLNTSLLLWYLKSGSAMTHCLVVAGALDEFIIGKVKLILKYIICCLFPTQERDLVLADSRRLVGRALLR